MESNSKPTAYKRFLYTSIACAFISLSGIAIAEIENNGSVSDELNAEPPENPESLIPIALTNLKPPLPNLDSIIKDRSWAIKLGKAFFWDQQTGSDGQACASCHFKAGADNRFTNSLSPGLTRVSSSGDPNPDLDFGGSVSQDSPAATAGVTASGNIARSNITLTPEDFPFHQLQDPSDRNSAVLYSTNDTSSSPGTFDGSFGTTIPRDLDEYCGDPSGDIFKTLSHYPARKVEPRNTPSVINAAYNFRNFWDGRGNNVFNGVDPFGLRNKDARIVVLSGRTPQLAELDLRNASLASQAVGPTLSDFEMSCAGRTFADVGRRMMSLRPLASQDVASDDSHLGGLVHPSGQGLTISYARMIRMAFQPQYWAGRGTYRIDTNSSEPSLVADASGHTQAELNFSMFWGIAIMLYEAELLSDQTPFDQYRGCKSPHCSPEIPADDNALSQLQKDGLKVFVDKGKCINCHKGPEFSSAATHLQAEEEEEGLVERMVMADNRVALYDNGFYNIGVKPTKEDLGVGAKDPWGNPLSFTRQFKQILLGQNVPDPFQVDPCTFEELAVNVLPCDKDQQLDELKSRVLSNKENDAVDGAFKTSILRNVALTAPYFHNGGYATLEQVVEFYNRGGNHSGSDTDNSTGFGPNKANLDPDIRALDLTEYEQQALVAFMKSLTDERVRCDQAPFDHPSLTFHAGHYDADSDGDGRADDKWVTYEAVGASGLPSDKCWKNSGDLFDQGGPL
ncbi:hypothetical protein A3K86_03255 [Photobacterium jeanii]|uniref:Cytochrome c domain-containing protein n=1 Tax=Photobacterium jeanii TaxID=858640 RepID=A0A178KKU7_9GAMM|nr:cytochrome c peroxidase [Photobacterium jeanii]OAN17949.1 hypothetical protein A3K86_03255 [Photobacterium jeanii]PST92381.1 cytochrome-c peroxidase [Photobacterium jeanii]